MEEGREEKGKRKRLFHPDQASKQQSSCQHHHFPQNNGGFMALLSSVPFGRPKWEMQHSGANPGLFRGTKRQRSPLLGVRAV